MRSWEGDRACLKALMSNRGKREMTKYNPANNVCLVDKKTTLAGKAEEGWETLRNLLLHKALGRGLYSG